MSSQQDVACPDRSLHACSVSECVCKLSPCAVCAMRSVPCGLCQQDPRESMPSGEGPVLGPMVSLRRPPDSLPAITLTPRRFCADSVQGSASS